MEDSETALEIKSAPKSVDRVTLGQAEGEKLSAWLKQLDETSSGFLQLSRSDVVNFLIRNHKAELSPREVQQIRAHHYDPVRHLNWITPRLKEALLTQDLATVARIQNEIKRIEFSTSSKSAPLPSESNNRAKPTGVKRRRIRKVDKVPVPEPSKEPKESDLPNSN